ncbi:MAG: glycosyltransferase family 2 protein [Patescibacteria group bacterium]|jgi:glycosyltransferase involved in cell wall biosynthesis
MQKKQLISIVIPLYNESRSIPELLRYLTEKCIAKLHAYTFELIFINDGSTDNTLKILQEISSQSFRLKIVSFRKNLGKSTALNEGFKRVSGSIVVTMDGDLQDGPENIPLLLSKLKEGYDLVVGWKKNRKDPFTKLLASKLFNAVMQKTSGLQLHDFNSGLKAFKTPVTAELFLYGELHRFIPFLAFQQGFSVTELPVIHHERKYGKSKYGGSRIFQGFFDYMTTGFLSRFSERPMHLFGSIGLLSIMFGVLFGSYLSVLHFQGISIGHRPLLMLSILLLLAGLQLFSIGLIAELMVRQHKMKDYIPVDYEKK